MAATHDFAARRPAIPPALAGAGFFGRPTLPTGLRYALLLDRLGQRRGGFPKPWAFSSLAELARSLHRRRAGRAIQLEETPLLVHPRRAGDLPLQGVTVWALDAGERRACLGWAYLGGAGREALTLALRAERPAFLGD